MDKTKYQFADVMPLAIAVRNTLINSCERIEIAGSLRRGKMAVSDIEIVAIPKIDRTGIFNDQEESRLDKLLNALACEAKITKIRGGDKAKTYTINTAKPTMQLDLFIANKVNWGLIMALRTGPADYSKNLVTQRHKGGSLDDTYRVKDGYLLSVMKKTGQYKKISGTLCERLDHSNDADTTYVFTEIDGILYDVVNTYEEEDFFKHIAGGYVEPNLRGIR